jgi:D(-)-tartrate dehydratase
MRIVDIRERAVPLKSNLRNAAFDFSDMSTSIVAVVTDVVRGGKPVVGYAFNSTGRYACGEQMRQRFIPRLLKAEPEDLLNANGTNFDPARILACMMQHEKPGGHAERSIAIGTIEVACWDAVAKIEEKPLYRVLAERYNGGIAHEKVPCYVGGGWYQRGKGPKELQSEIRRRLNEGYTTMKIKVGGASIPDDVRRVEAALEVLDNGERLAVDANGCFRRDRALAYTWALTTFNLRWFEEPTDPLDFALLAELTEHYMGPLATGENLFSTQDAENLVRYSQLRPDRDVLQFDIPQSYGIVQFSRTLEMLKNYGWARTSIYPHGGNQMTLHIVAGFGLGGCEAYPEVFGPFAGFADGTRVEDGWLRVPDRPGIGFEAQDKLYALMRELAADVM